MKKRKSKESDIYKLQNSVKEEDRARVDSLKEELQNVEDDREMENARRYFAKNNSEGERPTGR